MTRRIPMVLIAVAPLFGCAPPDQQFMDEAKRRVTVMMKDPDSAKFADIYLVPSGGQVGGLDIGAVCGLVKGKNGFGGYSGYERFVASGTYGNVDGKTYASVRDVRFEGSDRRATAESVDQASRETIFEAIIWNASCVDARHPPTYSGDAWR